MKKRLISMLLVISILTSLLPATVLAAGTGSVSTKNPFTDVAENAWYYSAVQYARVNRFFSGTTETTFDPDGTMNRAMFITVLAQMADADVDKYMGKTSYQDVALTAWYAPFIAWAYTHGVTDCLGTTYFDPDAVITRQEMAAVFMSYFDKFGVDYNTGKEVLTIPADLSEVDADMVSAVLRMWRLGLLSGDGVNYDPTGNVTRAQAAALCRNTDKAVSVWYKEPGVPADRVSIDPETGSTIEKAPQESSGEEEEEVLPDDDLSGDTNICTVRFYDGKEVIDTMHVHRNDPLGKLPGVEKSSRENAILVGYYTDRAFTQPFYAEEPVTDNMKVYARYEEMESLEQLSFTSFAQMDQDPDLSFEIERISGKVSAGSAVTLAAKDGSEPVELEVVDSDDDGIYEVYAPDGFNEGCSYELTLAEGWIFAGKAETIRTAAFSIDMEEVENLQMNNAIVYIKDTASMDYTVNGKKHSVLTSDLVTTKGGTFSYSSASSLKAGDLLCVYVGVHPDQRENGKDLLDPAVYVKVSAVKDTTVTFAPLDEEDQQELYDIPDNFPIKVSALPTAAAGTVKLSALDVEMYATMMGEDGTMAKAKEAISVGDFVTLYVSQSAITSEKSLYYGQITAYDAATGTITYKQTTRQSILESMDLYARVDVDGSDMVTDEEKAVLEEELLAQVEQSDFAEDAAFMLADLITRTDGFRENMGVQQFLLTDKAGTPLSDEDIQLLNLGGSFELTDDIKLTVELITRGDQLHFDGGVQLAIGVDAGFEVEAEEGKIAFDLSATFVQEVTIDPRVKGKIVTKEILWIPVPIGVKVDASIDIRSFTALSFSAEIYTVEEKDKSVWEKLQNIAKEPAEALGLDNLPDELVKGLSTVGDVMDKIDELNDAVDKAKDAKEQYEGYLEDIDALWAVVEDSGLTSREDWEEMGDTLGKTSITSDLLEMMNMTTETGLSTEYLESFQDLMDRYAEMLEKETGWVTLVDQEILTVEVNVLGLAIGVEASFVVRTDMSLAIGSNLEYEIGKRYSFWFKIGLFKPSAGSSSMDLIDERFAFQFYVMGRMGVKAGVSAKLYVGLGSGKFASVGIATELGPYIKLYGFFVYENSKYRPANTDDWEEVQRMAGALFMEFGLYFILSFEANALGDLFEYTYDFVDAEIPLVTAGDQKYYYANDYAPAHDEMVLVRDEDDNSKTGITMVLPQYMMGLKYIELDTGFMGVETLKHDAYLYSLSNPNFSFDPETGIISVDVPKDSRYMECDMTITYRYGKMAFSQYDMSVTIPLVWTNLSDAELSEYYTASVRVGNDEDGYQTVWTQRVRKNQEFDLPTDDEIRTLMGWNEYKYDEGDGYGDQQLEGVTLIEDMVYDYDVDFRTYTITVEDIQKTSGATYEKEFTAMYGESFDFSALESTGTGKNDVYTRFVNVTTEDTVEVSGEPQVIDLKQPITNMMAAALEEGVTATANYADDSVSVTFSFTGLDHKDISMKLRKGTAPDLGKVEEVASDAGLAVKDIAPIVTRVYSPTTYQVVCGELTGPKATVSFEENGGQAVNDITKVVGSLIGTLPTPKRAGYTFGGWYTDNNTFKKAWTSTKMPSGGVTLYAKWTAGSFTVTFNVNGGNALDKDKQTGSVTTGSTYGTLPTPTRSGYSFVGWFTDREGGTQVTSSSKVNLTANQTLYAQWKQLLQIPDTVFDFGEPEQVVYEKDKGHEVLYTFTPGEGDTYKENSFTFKYMRQGATDYEEGLPVDAGTYNVTVSRKADSTYAKFEQTYSAVITVDKAVREPWTVMTRVVDNGYTWVEMELVNDNSVPGMPIVDGGIYDLNERSTVIYNIITPDGTFSSDGTDNIVRDIQRTGAELQTSVTVLDPNYEDWTSNVWNTSDPSLNLHLKEAPTDSWGDEGNYDISWWTEEGTEFTISTPAQLAGLAWLANNSKDSFANNTITLAGDINMTGHSWTPIGQTGSPFRGVFDGDGHTISGLYFDDSGKNFVGLFGDVYGYSFVPIGALSNMVGGTTIVQVAEIKNVVVDDSYLYGRVSVGGIVGRASASRTGGPGTLVSIDNCTSYAQVHAKGNYDEDYSQIGGIAGKISSCVLVTNCVNYGLVSAAEPRTGGIIGYMNYGTVANCANFGTVLGTSRVGGIVGTMEETAYIHNCYNCGMVKGLTSNDYIGAVVGRNVSNDGYVKQGYYLKNTAFGKDGKSRTATGKDGGSVKDGDKVALKRTYVTAVFNDLDYKMSDTAGSFSKGNTLIQALNAWVDSDSNSVDAVRWIAEGPDGYPIPQGSLLRDE